MNSSNATLRLSVLLGVLFALSTVSAAERKKREEPVNPVKPDAANEAYGAHAANVFDLWLPKSEKPAPLLIYIHGGGFRAGDKSLEPYALALRDACLKEGIALASLEYRLSHVARYPAQMHDCARALQYLRHHAVKWNLDPKRVAVTGNSAGAGITMWLGFHDDLADPKAEDPIKRESTRVVCILPRNGQCTYDPRVIKTFVPGAAYDHPALKQLHGLQKSFNWETDKISDKVDVNLKDCSALTHLTKDDPPVFQMHFSTAEREGDIHHPNFGVKLEEELKQLGIECISRKDVTTWPGYTAEALQFLKKHFGM